MKEETDYFVIKETLSKEDTRNVDMTHRKKWKVSYAADGDVATAFVPGFDKDNPNAAAKSWRRVDPWTCTSVLACSKESKMNQLTGWLS